MKIKKLVSAIICSLILSSGISGVETLLLPYGWEYSQLLENVPDTLLLDLENIESICTRNDEPLLIDIAINLEEFTLMFTSLTDQKKWINSEEMRQDFIYLQASNQLNEYQINRRKIEFYNVNGPIIAPGSGNFLNIGKSAFFSVFITEWNGYIVTMIGVDGEKNNTQLFLQGDILGRSSDGKIVMDFVNGGIENLNDELKVVFVKQK